jgi:hypothetical protein
MSTSQLDNFAESIAESLERLFYFLDMSEAEMWVK